mmetsp:Transcript_11444/g.27315  ORF Transcript_11444/g.27315 Transcript_11444/m.27315 type:complete len:712 (+) Transcript_11444:522-2657(+)
MSSSIATTTLTQDEIKAELKELMQLPENMICSDCDDKRPTWASLIVPPPNAPFKDPIGCFCCFQCSGPHRMLGTHISFVRSTNLDEWKEKELISMRQGGNKLVNGLFEGKLTDGQRKVVRPDNHTDLETRKNYIFEKYQDRKWFSQESYDVCRPRDRLDAALSSFRSQKLQNKEVEDDFFSQRAMNAAPNNNNNSISQMSIDERSAECNKPSNDSDWWKVSGNSSISSTSTPSSKKNALMSPKASELSSWKSPNPFDRRSLMSSVQKESQRKLMAEFNHIDAKNGSLKPSSFRLKPKRPPTRKGSGQRHGSSTSHIMSEETAPLKEESPTRPRSQLLRQRGVSRNNSSSSTHSTDSSKKPPRRPGVSRTYSNSSSHCSEGSDKRRDKRGASRTHSSSSSRSTDDRNKSRSSRSKHRGVSRTSSSGSGSYASSGDGSTQPRKPIRSSKDHVPRAKSFDQMLSLDSNPSPNSATNQNRVRKTHSDRVPRTPVRSPKGNGSFIDDIHASLAQINMNIAGDDELMSPRQPQRRRPDRTNSAGGGDDESQTNSRRILQAVRDDKIQVSSHRRSTRPSSKLDDSSSQLSVGDRRVRSSSLARSPRARSQTRKGQDSKSPRRRDGSRSRQYPPSRTPSPDLWRNAIPPMSPGGGGGGGAPVAGSRVPKDRKPRVPSRPISSSSIPSTSPRPGPGSASRQVVDTKLETKLSTEMINVKW